MPQPDHLLRQRDLAVLVGAGLQPGLLEFDSVCAPRRWSRRCGQRRGAAQRRRTFTVTYRIRPEARWSDGTPITSTDVRFTWRAILDTQGSLQTIGYDLVTCGHRGSPHRGDHLRQALRALAVHVPQPVLPAHAFNGNTDISGYWNRFPSRAGLGCKSPGARTSRYSCPIPTTGYRNACRWSTGW